MSISRRVFRAWSVDPAVLPSRGDTENLSASSVQQVLSAEMLPT